MRQHRITGLFTLFRPAGQTGPVGGSGYGFARSFALLIPTQNLRHILSALVFAAQSPYPGHQNPLIPHKRLRYSRNVMRNFECPKYSKINIDITEKN
jgi:hypothetical protein